MRMHAVSSLMIGVLFMVALLKADEPKNSPGDTAIRAVIDDAVKAAGGQEQLPALFRLRERLVLNPDGVKTGSERQSVIEPPRYWWLGKKERVRDEKEPAIFLVWAWTLGAFKDPASKLSRLDDIMEDGQTLRGIRISESITPPMDCYFERESGRLIRIDWRSDIHRFSEWKESEGFRYPSRTKGYKKKDNRFWYQTDVLEVTKLTELPEGLSR